METVDVFNAAVNRVCMIRNSWTLAPRAVGFGASESEATAAAVALGHNISGLAAIATVDLLAALAESDVTRRRWLIRDGVLRYAFEHKQYNSKVS